MGAVKVSTPGKLMLFGEHAVIYNRPCLVTAVNQRLTVEIGKTTGSFISLDAPDVGITGYQKKITKLGLAKDLPKGVRFIERALVNFQKKYQLGCGLEIKTKSEFSSSFGFGSSAAVTVGLLKALSVLLKKRMGNQPLFNLAYQTVLDVQGVGSGFDLAAAIWGGSLYFVTGGKKIVPLKKKSLPLVIGYTGIKADTPTLVRKVGKLKINHPALVEDIFNFMTKITNEARSLIGSGSLVRLGELMNFNQGLLNSLGVSSFELEKLIFAAREGGAWGAKLSGAGGGDCFLSLVSKTKRSLVEKAIRKAGGEVINVQTGAQGVRVE